MRSCGPNKKRECDYLVFEQKIDVEDINELQRLGLRKAPLAIALPFMKDAGVDTDKVRDFYSFLPVGPGPFRFLLNGDFVLTGNREQIQEDKRWNQKLRDSIHKVLVKTILFAQKNKVKCFESMMLFLEPTANGLVFFDEVLPDAIELLKEEKCILTTEGKWAKPKDVYLKDKLGLIDQEIVSPADIKRCLYRKHLRHPSFEGSDELLKSLGCEEFECREFCELLNEKAFWNNRAIHWYCDLYGKISELYHEGELSWNDINGFKDDLKIPTSDGKF